MGQLIEITDKLPQVMQPYGRAISFWADEYGFDPFVFAGILWCETEAGTAPGYSPQGPEGLGDGGNGHGLFQVDGRWHASMVKMVLADGSMAWKKPAFNAGMGASIFAQTVAAFPGDYPSAVCAYNAGLEATRKALYDVPTDASASARISALDKITGTGRYVSDVLRCRAQYAGLVSPV